VLRATLPEINVHSFILQIRTYLHLSNLSLLSRCYHCLVH